MKRYICAYMGPGESNCQGWQMPLHALPTQIVFTRVILVIIFLTRAPRTVTFQQQQSFEGTRSRLLETGRSRALVYLRFSPYSCWYAFKPKNVREISES